VAEPFGRVLVEAMAMEVPVVAFARGAVPEIVLDGRTGLLVERGGEEALARAVIGLIKDPERRKMMGMEGRKRVESLFSAELMVEKIMQIYSLLT